MNRVAVFAERLNLFLYRQNIRKLGPTDIETAREWCFDLIRREHPRWTEKQVADYYEDLINVEFFSVDEWTRRMSG